MHMNKTKPIQAKGWRYASADVEAKFKALCQTVGTVIDDADLIRKIFYAPRPGYVEHQRTLIKEDLLAITSSQSAAATAASLFNPLLQDHDEYLTSREKSELKQPRSITYSLRWLMSFCIPTQKAIQTILKYGKKIVDVGAGTGYWSMLLNDAGGDVIAFDKYVSV